MTCRQCGVALPPGSESCPACHAPVGAAGADTPTQPLVDGQTAALLGADHELLRPLGRGGMGTVYLAREVALDRSVAVKVLQQGDASPESIERFLQEARLAARLAHPNIVPIHRIGHQSGVHYFTMAHVDGETLEAHVRRLGPLPAVEAARIAGAVASAVAHAHALGVLHRDLKPSNVMLDRSGHVFVMDFGLAKARDLASLSGSGIVVGTPQYVSPEQLRGEPATERSDIYALGLLLAYLRTGGHVVHGESAAGIVGQHLAGAPAQRLSSDVRLGPDERVLLAGMVALDPSRRIGDAAALAAQLSAAGRGSSAALPAAPAPPSSRPDVGPRGAASRGRTLLAAAIAAVLAVAFLLVVRRPEEPAGRKPREQVVRRLTSSGRALLPSLAPDGKAVAFVESSGPGARDIVVQDLATGSRLTLLAAVHASWLDWSPDGTEIAVAIEPGRDSASRILVIPRFGGSSRSYPGSTVFGWSPDGTRFVLASAAAKSLRIVDRKTGSVSEIALPGNFDWVSRVAWHPAGDPLLYAALAAGGSVLRTIPVAGGPSRDVVTLGGLFVDAAWAPDGRALYYLEMRGSTGALMRQDLPGEGAPPPPVLVLPDVPSGGGGRISIAGDLLAYARTTESAHLWGGGGATSGKPVELTAGTQLDLHPVLSPEADRIAFVRGDRAAANVFVMPSHGGAATQVTFQDAPVEAPCWSPDGREIAFASKEGGAWSVWRAKPGGSTARPFEDTACSRDVTWAPASFIVYQTPDNRSFIVLDPATGARRPLLPGGFGWVFTPRSAADGRIAFLGNTPGCRGIFTVPAGGGEPTLLMEAGEAQLQPVGFLDGGRQLLVAVGNVGETITLDATTGARLDSRKVLEAGTITSVSSDGQRCVAQVTESRSDVWLVEGFDRER